MAIGERPIDTRQVNGWPKVLYGHRGAARERPENTLVSFERAVEAGADAIETDVHVTRDGALVLAHDETGARMAGDPRAIRDVSLDEIARWDVGWGFIAPDGSRPFAGKGIHPPTLEEALAAFPDIPLNIDIKAGDPRAVEPIIALIRRHAAEHRVRLASFDLRVIAAVRRRGYQGGTSLCRAEVALALVLPAAALRRIPELGDAAQIPDRAAGRDLGRRRFIDKLHRAGLRVDFWTIDDPARAGELLAQGADGIITDDPAAIRPVFDRFA